MVLVQCLSEERFDVVEQGYLKAASAQRAIRIVDDWIVTCWKDNWKDRNFSLKMAAYFAQLLELKRYRSFDWQCSELEEHIRLLWASSASAPGAIPNSASAQILDVAS